MAGISPIVTDGFLFTPSLIVTAGFLSGTPAPVIPMLSKGGLPPGKKKKNQKQRFQENLSPRETLMQILDRMNEAEEEEIIMRMVRSYFE